MIYVIQTILKSKPKGRMIHVSLLFFQKGLDFILRNLKEHHGELLSHMEQNRYSKTYISLFRNEIQRILKKSENNTWISYLDIYKEYEKSTRSRDYLRNKKTIIGALQEFDLNGFFPDGRRSSLTTRGSYHLLVPDFKEVVSEILGHAKTSTTQNIYSHATETMQKASINRIEDLMFSNSAPVENPKQSM